MASKPRNYARERSLSAWESRARGGRREGRRDYEAETAVRVIKGAARGLSRTEARGHPEESPRAVSVTIWNQVEAAASTAVDSILWNGPDKGGGFAWFYIAVDAEGKETTIRLGKVAEGGFDPRRIEQFLKRRRLPPLGAPWSYGGGRDPSRRSRMAS